MKKTKIVTLLIFLSTILQAQPKLNFGIDNIYRSYSEKLIAPAKSDEYGRLGGFYLGMEIPFDKLYLHSSLSLSAGTTHYDGSLQNLITGEITPHDDTTLNILFETTLDVGWKISASTLTFIPYASLGTHKWSRLLQDGKAKISHYSFDEYYTWIYCGLGTKIIMPLNEKFSIEFDLTAKKMINGKMEVKNHGISNIDKGYVNLGNKFHYFATTKFNIFLNKKVTLQIMPHFESRPIGKSDINTKYGYLEPESTTYVGGVKIGLDLIL